MNKVLVVDDKAANLELVVSFLGTNGYKCLIAKNGKDAIVRAETTLPDIILLDIQMPEMDGFETCTRLKMKETTSNIPVIFMTALDDTTDKVKGFDVGGVDYITKPIDSEELLARVETHLTVHKLKNDLEQSLRAKDKLLKSNREKTEELMATQKELFKTEKMASLGYLVSGIAHELNTPLSIGITSCSQIKEETDLLLKKLIIDDPEINRSFSSIIACNNLIFSNLNKLGVLIKRFKNLSTIPANAHLADLNIKEFIERCLKITKGVLSNPKAQIIINSGEYLVKDINPDAIENIMNNLYENSIIHGFKEDSVENIIEIDIHKDEKDLILEYKDNGTGIKEDIASKIFDPFFTSNKSKGIGLGLSVVYNIVTQILKGKVDYKKGNHGAHFIIKFEADVKTILKEKQNV